MSSAGDGTWTDAGIQQALEAGQSLAISFNGVAYPAGSATYTVDTANGPVSAGGDGLACDAAPVTTGEVVDPSGGQETEEQASPDDAVVEASTQDVVDETQTEESGTADAVPVDVTVTVTAFDCPAVPPAGTTGGCTPSVGVVLAATVDGTDAALPPTNGSGTSTIVAPEGSTLIVGEDWSSIPAGYSPYGDGVAVLAVSQADAAITFLHLVDPIVGRLQIINGSCPTSGESRTEFRVIEPRSVVIADAPACEATGGTVFTITGGSLGGGIEVTTGDDGAWRGFLPAGTYTVIDDSTASADVTVIEDDISVVIAVDYVSHPLGVLSISRFACEDPNPTGVAISFEGSEPAFGDGCTPTDSEIQIDVLAEVSAASVATVTLGADGVEEIELEPGSYTLTDLTSGASSNFTIDGGVRVWAVVRDIVAGGDGVGEPGGGGNPGDGDGTGNPGNGGPGGDDDGDSGTGSPGDYDGGTDGGVDAGVSSGDGVGDDGEVLNVTALPETGVHPDGGSHTGELLALIAVIGGLGVGAATSRRTRVRRGL